MLNQAVAELKADDAEREARITRRNQLIIALFMVRLLTLIGFAIAILPAVLL